MSVPSSKPSSTKRRVPVLQVHIPSPCQENWGAMTGDAQRRHCARCDHEVHDVSAMAPDAARELLTKARPGEVCVRGFFEADGTPVTHAEMARRSLRSRSAAAVLAAAMLSVVGCESEAVPEQTTGALVAVTEHGNTGDGSGAAQVTDAGAVLIPNEVVEMMGEPAVEPAAPCHDCGSGDAGVAPEKPSSSGVALPKPTKHLMGKPAMPLVRDPE
ncbi:MAG: hypothetical protein QM778_27770 [Myxococcales bacterium]